MTTLVFVEEGRNGVWDRAREGVPPLLYLLCVSMFTLSLDENLEAGGKILSMRDRENGIVGKRPICCMLRT